MFFGRLRDDDSFGLVAFDTSATVLIPCTRKDQLGSEHVFAVVKGIGTRGGTNLRCGFECGTEALRSRKGELGKGEPAKEPAKEAVKEAGKDNGDPISKELFRLVMLTDVNDDMGLAAEFVQARSAEGLHTTIVGISDDFRSETCQRLAEVRGFNYFCATEDADLKRHLF